MSLYLSLAYSTWQDYLMDMSRYFWRSHTSPVQERAPNMLFFSFALFDAKYLIIFLFYVQERAPNILFFSFALLDAKYLCHRKSHCLTPPRATPVQRTVPLSEFGIGFSTSGFGIAIHSCALLQNFNNVKKVGTTLWFHLTQIGKDRKVHLKKIWGWLTAFIVSESAKGRKQLDSQFLIQEIFVGSLLTTIRVILLRHFYWSDLPQNRVCRTEVGARWAYKPGGVPIQNCASSCSPDTQTCERKYGFF